MIPSIMGKILSSTSFIKKLDFQKDLFKISFNKVSGFKLHLEIN